MSTVERNYRKNPHTARFLLAFHTGGTGLPADRIEDDNDAEYRLAAEENHSQQDHIDDLLETVPVEAPPRDKRTRAQRAFMDVLIEMISKLDPADGERARIYTDGMTAHGKWTPGREGNASAWICRMVAKRDELRAAARKAVPAGPAAQVADGRYAVEHNGELKFFKVKNGKQSGFVFIDRQSSDDYFPIRNAAVKAEILRLIAADPKAATIRYGRELGVCGRCGRTLTDEASRAAGIGPICIDK